MPTILLVEDNELNRDMLSRRLGRRGFEVLHAATGEQALALAFRSAPDLILMDITLPEMDGWEATRRLKADAQTGHIPVIALTARVLSTDRQQAFDAGCDDYDTKPVDFQRLTGKIHRFLPAGSRASQSSVLP